MSEPAVHISDLRVRRGGVTVLDGLNLTIPKHQITGLLGPSGGGKSTLMRAIAGVQRNTNGTVKVLGQPAGSAMLRKKIGYPTQDEAVYTDLTVEQNLRYFGRILRVAPSRISETLAVVDLEPQRKQTVASLSLSRKTA